MLGISFIFVLLFLFLSHLFMFKILFGKDLQKEIKRKEKKGEKASLEPGRGLGSHPHPSPAAAFLSAQQTSPARTASPGPRSAPSPLSVFG